MIKQLLSPQLFFLAVSVITGCEVTPERPAITSVDVGKVEVEDYYIRSIEPPEACGDFSLTEADVREFFKVARAMPTERDRALPDSRCLVENDLVLQDGRTAHLRIDRARNGLLSFPNDPEVQFLYCDQCRSEKYYSESGQKLSDWRPAIKSIVVQESGTEGDNAEDCKDFTLTETDVHEFFKVARAASNRELTHETPQYACNGFTVGSLVLQDGKTAKWGIEQRRYGWLLVPSPGYAPDGVFTLYFYCSECRSEKYGEDCDNDCEISAE
jgi:hypothetical protein